jgi:hypothetical protein
MKTWVRKTLSVGILAAGALLFAPGAAHAGGHGNGGGSGFAQVTGANNGILNGTQIGVPINVPINVCGNSLGILGEANATAICANRTEGARDVQATGANNGILNGTQVLVPINVPVNAVGNSAAVLGAANSTGVGVNGARGRKAESAHTTEGFGPGFAQVTGANNGILNGTQIGVPINIPINVCGNSLALLGAANSRAICGNDVFAGHRGNGWMRESGHTTEGAQGGPGFVQATGANNGILNGTQIGVPINIPINVCGNSLGVLGEANSAALCANDVSDDPWGWGGGHGNGGHGHGHGGHGNGGGQNAGDNGDNGDGSYLGDNGSKPGNGGGNDGYGHGNGGGNSGYGHDNGGGNGGYSHGGGATKPATGSDSDAKGGRESLPVSNLTDSVSGLSLLDSLR